MYCTSYNIGTPKSLKGIFLIHTNMHAQTHTHEHTHAHTHTHIRTQTHTEAHSSYDICKDTTITSL